MAAGKSNHLTKNTTLFRNNNAINIQMSKRAEIQ